ncbi:hypothetical protein BU17DRAFT_53785 [Hysterangium stoloniferum]|nr:hypothetical protein BU17DRAFT_53785 [Hysterangium stoloniferum]
MYVIDRRNIGATIWGRGATSNLVFACSEASEGEPTDTLFHGAFDVNSGKHVYHFDDHRSGEELALDHDGRKLALFTNDGNELFFRLYDVARTRSVFDAECGLPCGGRYDLEVRKASWSPDGTMLAVGTNEDNVYVYDARLLHKIPRPILSFSHQTRSPSQLGITILEWAIDKKFARSRLGLLTGGGDQRVVLTNLSVAREEPFIVAEIQGEIAGGSFGDMARDETPLVVGDINGRMHMFKFKTNDL